MNTHRSPIRKRAKIALAWGAAAAILLQLGLAVAIERWLPQYRDPEYGFRMQRLYRRSVAASTHPMTIVMLGSSRTTKGFKASQLEKELKQALGHQAVVFNFGITGAGPIMQTIDLKRLLAGGVHPDLLLIEVLPPLLAGQTPHEVNRLPATRLWLREIRPLARYGAATRKLREDWLEEWPVPWYSHRFAIMSHLAPNLLRYEFRMDYAHATDDSGWIEGPVREPSQELRRRATDFARADYARYFADFRLDGPASQAFRDLLDLCRASKIKTALVLMPEGSEFQSWYPPAVWSEIDAYLHRLSQEYDAPIINARNWIADDYFADSHHLLPYGAELFTERLGKDAVLPLVRMQVQQTYSAEAVLCFKQAAARSVTP